MAVSMVAAADLLALLITPARYQATGYVQIVPTNRFSHYSEEDHRQMQRAQDAVVNEIRAIPFQKGVVAVLRERGISSHAAEHLASTVRSERICESRLVKITADSSSPLSAQRAASIAVEAFRAIEANLAVEVIRRPDLPVSGARSKVPALLAGAGAAIVYVVLHQLTSARRS